MNKLIIIGNGFDLAHKNETSYEAFLRYHVQESLKKEKTNFYSSYYDIDKNTSPFFNLKFSNIPDKKEFYKICDNLIEHLGDLGSFSKLMDSDISQKNFKIETANYRYTVPNLRLSIFSESIKSSSDISWSGIESTYFAILVKVFNSLKDDEPKLKRFTQSLNKELHDIKLELINYLKQLNFKEEKLNSFTRLLDASKEKEKILILNFNYTKTLNLYNDYFPLDTEIINIHGYIDNPQGIIFGYGDLSQPKIPELQDANIDSLLINLKSNQYPSDRNYKKLNSFLNSLYDVFIVGHSCGISDRVLLQEIFENDNCHSIKLYLNPNKKEEDYNEKVVRLSRMFKNQNKLLKILHAKNESLLLN